jgi:hypothetical protein
MVAQNAAHADWFRSSPAKSLASPAPPREGCENGTRRGRAALSAKRLLQPATKAIQMSKALKCAAFLLAFIAPGASFASGIGDFTGTSTPQVVTPGAMAAPPQTPAYAPPPIGPVFVGPPVSSASHYHDVTPPPRPRG